MMAVRRVAAGVLALLLTAAPGTAEERVLNFIADIAVARNGDVVVTDTIRIEVEGKVIQRGLVRDIPVISTQREGKLTKASFELESVTRNGSAENSVVEPSPGGVRIRIGQADRLLPHGQHEYVMRYRVTDQVDSAAGFDWLTWNVTGIGWTFTIDQAQARVTLPDKVPFRTIRFVTGPTGAQGAEAAILEQQPGRVVVQTARALPPGNGLTIAATWNSAAAAGDRQ